MFKTIPTPTAPNTFWDFFWIWSKLGSKKHLLIEYFGELGLLKHEHGMLAIPDTRIAEKTDEDVNDYHCPEPRS